MKLIDAQVRSTKVRPRLRLQADHASVTALHARELVSRSGSPFQLRFSLITNVEGLDSGRISSLGISRGGDPRSGRISQPLQELLSCMTDFTEGSSGWAGLIRKASCRR